MDLSELEKVLLQPDFDVEKHAANLVQQGININKYVENLSQAERVLDEKLEDHVSLHYNDLLCQATSVERLETHLSSVSSQSESLLNLVDRLSGRINEPHDSMKSQTVTLTRLQKTCDILRKIIRILQLSKKLQVQLHGDSAEITKAAASLNELMELWQPADELNGIEIIEQDQRAILHAKNEVEQNADAMLWSGMESKSQNQMGVALQVFFNLNILPEKVGNVQATLLKHVKTKAAEYLDAKKINDNFNVDNVGHHAGPGRTSRSVPSSANLSAFRNILWNNVEHLLDLAFCKIGESMQLQKILVKKRDIVLGMNFIELLNDQNIVCDVWKEVISILSLQFQQSSADSSTIKQAFEGEFPKLIRLFNDFWSRLCQAANNNNAAFVNPESNLNLINPFEDKDCMDEKLRQVFVPFERQYLSRSLSRLFDPVNLMFASGIEAPKTEELDQVFRAINSEVAIAQVDKVLFATVVKNVAKTVRLMCAKCEQMLDGQASQVVGYPTNEQRRNVQVINCLYAFYQGVEHHLVQDHPDSLADIDNLIKSSIEPLIQSINDAIEAILLTMHNEDFNVETYEDSKMSPHMKELQTFITRIKLDFLSKFHCKNLVAESCVPLISRGIDMFIIQASLVRPLSLDAGQKKLLKDCDNLELALEPISQLVASRNGAFVDQKLKELNAFKSLISAKAEDFPEANVITDGLIKHSIALHMLFARAPPEMKHPHESVNWSISRYSTWLEEHPKESDRLQFIQGALESYVASTRARKEKSYAYPYNIMLNLLQDGKNQ